MPKIRKALIIKNELTKNRYQIIKISFKKDFFKKKLQQICTTIFHVYICSGGMAEWSIAAVLKTVEPKGSRGSNPFSSAERDF